MNQLAKRFSETISMYFRHDLARTPAPPKPEPEPEAEGTSAENSKHANSTKAVQTRKAKYGKSKLKRKTRDNMRKGGSKVDTEGE